MNCTQSGQQTDVSAPGVGQSYSEASPGHDVAAVAPPPPAARLPTHCDSRRHRFPGRFTFRPKREPPGTGVLGFASSVNSYLRALGTAGPVSARERLFLATPALELANS
jgi:hypothetical protein